MRRPSGSSSMRREVASGVSGLGYELFARMVAKEPGDERVQAQLYYLKSMQRPDGSWRVRRQPSAAHVRRLHADRVHHPCARHVRPSRARSRHQAAHRSGPGMAARGEASDHSGARVPSPWLDVVEGRCRRIRQAMASLQQLQQQDGGWSQLAAMESDAYATGVALYAMSQAGLSTKDASYQAGLRRLIGTQAADGTWHVKIAVPAVSAVFRERLPLRSRPVDFGSRRRVRHDRHRGGGRAVARRLPVACAAR